MKRLEASIEIQASPRRIWEILTDFDAYPDWNPLIRRISGEPRVGETLEVRIALNGCRGLSFRPTVLVAEPSRELRWSGRFLHARLFEGEHAFVITPESAARVRFEQREVVRGALVPLFARGFDGGTLEGFRAMNSELKRRAENGAGATAIDRGSAPRLAAIRDGIPRERYPFHDRIEIGRLQEGRPAAPGLLQIADATVSSCHCTLTIGPDGRCFIRGVSRNGTRVDGRRLVPNQEVEITNGQVITVGLDHSFLLEGLRGPAGAGASGGDVDQRRDAGTRRMEPQVSLVTILVGDIRDYTTLVQAASTALAQRSVRRAFEALEREVVARGGFVKDYQGDAIFAFWEAGAGESEATRACRAAIALDALARRIAADPTLWEVPDHPLRMDWALATGRVLIDTFGGDHPVGLSMIGDPVVLAPRMEKLANEALGNILACPATAERASAAFEFRELGEMQMKGFDRARRVLALLGPRERTEPTVVFRR